MIATRIMHGRSSVWSVSDQSGKCEQRTRWKALLTSETAMQLRAARPMCGSGTLVKILGPDRRTVLISGSSLIPRSSFRLISWFFWPMHLTLSTSLWISRRSCGRGSRLTVDRTQRICFHRETRIHSVLSLYGVTYNRPEIRACAAVVITGSTGENGYYSFLKIGIHVCEFFKVSVTCCNFLECYWRFCVMVLCNSVVFILFRIPRFYCSRRSRCSLLVFLVFL